MKDEMKDIAANLKMVFFALFCICGAIWGAQFDCAARNIDTVDTLEQQCIVDCQVRSSTVERRNERPRWNKNKECWCFDGFGEKRKADEEMETITNSKNLNGEERTNERGDPYHPNCETCGTRIALMFYYNPEETNLSRSRRKPLIESYCTRAKCLIPKKNSNTCPLKTWSLKETKAKSK